MVEITTDKSNGSKQLEREIVFNYQGEDFGHRAVLRISTRRVGSQQQKKKGWDSPVPLHNGRACQLREARKVLQRI